MISSVTTVVAVVLLGQPANTDLELDQVIQRAMEATHTAAESTTCAVGSGTFEKIITEIVDGKRRERVAANGTFSTAFSGSEVFVMLKYVSSNEWHYDAQVFICDGTTILQSVFSRTADWAGASGDIDRATPSGLFSDCGLNPHQLAVAWTFIDRIDELHPNATKALRREDGLLIIRVTDQDGYVMRFHIDPNQGYHITRYDDCTADGKVYDRVRKEWARTEDGLWYVRCYDYRHWHWTTGSASTGWKYEFTSYKPNIDIPPDLFTVDALGLPTGARIIDRRVRPNDLITVEPAKVDLALLEEVVGELPTAIPARRPTPRPPLPAPEPEPGESPPWLLIALVATALIGIGVRYWAVRRGSAP